MASIANAIPSPRSPAPQRDPVFIWPSPSNADYIFWVEKDGDIPANKEFTYGDPYPDSVAYPNHKLVFVSPKNVSPQNPGKWSRWYYASDRINQDDYNFDYVTADLGGHKFNAVTRTYLKSRQEFDPYGPASGSSMPRNPEEGEVMKFGGAEMILVNRETKRTDDKIFDSLFLIEAFNYIERVSITDYDADAATGRAIKRVTRLYFSGEEYSSGLTINQAFDTGSIFGSSGGSEVTGQQLSAEWFAVTTSSIPGIDDIYITYPSASNFNLPPVLVSIDAVWHEDTGNGESDSQWRGVAFGAHRSLSGSESNTVHGSASLIPEIVPVIREYPSSRIPTTSHFFFLPTADASLSSILSKVGAAAQWPVFKPESVSFALLGGKKSIQVSASAAGSYATGDNGATGSTDLTKGDSESVDVSPFISTVTLPPTLHDGFNITNAEHDDITFEVEATSGWTDGDATLEGSGSAPSWSSISGFPRVTSSRAVDSAVATVSGSISPTGVTGTSPTAIPTSGVYLVDCRVEPHEHGYVRVFAETVDASAFALT